MPRHGLTPRVHFTTWDDYAIVSMVKSGLGISILPELILRRFLEYLPLPKRDAIKTQTLPEKQGGVCIFFVRQ